MMNGILFLGGTLTDSYYRRVMAKVAEMTAFH
jgi:hypothetical protein